MTVFDPRSKYMLIALIAMSSSTRVCEPVSSDMGESDMGESDSVMGLPYKTGIQNTRTNFWETYH